MKEYLRIEDAKEFQLGLQDAPPIYFMYLVEQIVSLTFDSNSASEVAKLLGILDMEFVTTSLVGSRREMMNLLSSMESIKFLVDILMDCKDAPERLAAILAQLVKVKVCEPAGIQDMIEDCKKFNLGENLNTPEDIQSVFGRLLTKFSSSCR